MMTAIYLGEAGGFRWVDDRDRDGRLAVRAQAPERAPLALEDIAARSGVPMSREAVVELVSGANVNWAAMGGGEMYWINRPDGTLSANRLGYNPHWKTGRGKWVVRADGQYCVDLDFGHMVTESWCWQFFVAQDQILMHVEPVTPGVLITFKR